MSFNAIKYLLISFVLLLAACKKTPQPLTPAQLERYIDSAAKAQLVDKQAEAAVQLERRLAIEAKPKADSIVAALSQPQSVRDSLQRLRERGIPPRPVMPEMAPHP